MATHTADEEKDEVVKKKTRWKRRREREIPGGLGRCAAAETPAVPGAGLGPVSSRPGPMCFAPWSPSRGSRGQGRIRRAPPHPRRAGGLGICVPPSGPWPDPPPRDAAPWGWVQTLAFLALLSKSRSPPGEGDCVRLPREPCRMKGPQAELKGSTQTHGAGLARGTRGIRPSIPSSGG